MKSLHPMAECVVGLDNKTVPQFHEVLNVESHLRPSNPLGVNPSNLYKSPINIVSNDPE